MRIKGMIVIGFLLMSASVCQAQDQPPRAMAENFFRMLQAGKVSQAYDQLFVGSSIPQVKPQEAEMVKRQTESGLSLYGKILGFELVREEKFGTSVVRLVYVLKSEKNPTVWELYFYKPKANWFLARFFFNDQFQLLEAKQ
ncbi:MAG: hypothetical protein HXY46_14590 [Syntrophaceae bacterium]|nr:hypothetical protein [Syntrophaceae bacterium]